MSLFSSRQISEFKRLVLVHLASLDEDTWQTFRYHDALMDDRWIEPSGDSMDLTPEELVQRCVLSSSQPIANVRSVKGKWNLIGEFDGQPIWFNSRAGIYVWSENPSAENTLQLWLSFPAYPRGWD